MSGPGFLYFTVLALVVAWPAAASAQPTRELPGVERTSDLELVETHQFEYGGEVFDEAEIYFSEYEAFYLIIEPRFETVLMVSPRGRSVRSVDASKLKRTGEIGAELAGGAVREDLGRYEGFRGTYTFQWNGVEARLAPRAPLLGRQSLASMKEHHRRYAHKSKAYGLKRRDLNELPLRKGEVLVRVFFSSSTPICERVVPKILRFEEELRAPGKRLRFEYYGVPRRVTDDPYAREHGVFGVPLAIVYVNGEEQGRLRALELDRPEENLLPLLSP